MPLANVASCVASSLEHLWNYCLRRCQPCRIVRVEFRSLIPWPWNAISFDMPDPILNPKLAGQIGGTRGGTGRRWRIGLHEANAATGNPVNVRGFV